MKMVLSLSYFVTHPGLLCLFSATYHLNKTIEITRVHLFTIITQYRAIFNDDEHSPLSQSRNSNINQNVIFFGWIRNKVRI